MRTVEEIVELATTAKLKAGPAHARRREVRDLWGGDIAVPLTEIYANERAATANLARQGIDGTAQRIASTAPHISWHVKRAGFKQHEDTARRKRQVSLGWHERNAMDLIRYKRARHIWSYAESPVQVRWRRGENIPEWQVRDPLATFTAPPRRLDDMNPEWAVFCYTLPLGYLVGRYPDAYVSLKRDGDSARTVVEVVEFTDAEQITLVAVGQKASSWDAWASDAPGQRGVLLEHVENPAHRQTVVVPGLIGLTDVPSSRIEGMVGKYIKAARLDALQGIAIEEGIFPKQWLVGRQGEVPKIVQIAEPRKGKIGIVSGGVIDTQTLNPGYKTDSALADLERAQRSEGGVPSTYSGEAFSGARTARMSDTVEGGALDYAIGEVQNILARSEQCELEIAADLARECGGSFSVSMYVSGKGVKGEVTYKGSELFADPCGGGVTVKYSMAGADRNQETQRVGMMMQLGLISDQTARERNPDIEDAELEKDRLTAEGLEKAVLTGLQQASLDPAFLPQVLEIARSVRTDRLELVEAAIKAHEHAQELQAQQAPPVPDGMAAAPEMMPGLGAPSAPMEAAPPAPPDGAGLAARLQQAIAGQAA